MPNLEDCIIRFEDSNPTLVRIENTSNNIGIGANLNLNKREGQHYLLLDL